MLSLSNERFCERYPKFLLLSIKSSPESLSNALVKILKSVDLPSPFAPIKPTLSPSFIFAYDKYVLANYIFNEIKFYGFLFYYIFTFNYSAYSS